MGIERLGDILLLESLAAGGMAEIFRAKQYGLSGFEKTIAVKRILPHFYSDDEFKEMFRAEANLSAQLQHPNIAQVYSNGEYGNFLYIVMEFVEGKNLRQLQQKSLNKNIPLPFELIAFIVCETAKGLDFAHNFVDERTGTPLNIIHRDVNHQNIMLSYEGAVKVVDFGVAKAADSGRHKTRAGVLKGKISYMSPEQVRGRAIDRRTDVFSLGVVLWELLAGTPLFMQDDEIATLEKIRKCEVPLLRDINPNIPEELERIVRKALEKEVTDRYASAKDFCLDLQKFLNTNYPTYFLTEVSAYLKNVFKEEIMEERLRKEKINQEARAYLVKNPILRPSKNKIFGQETPPITTGHSLINENPNLDEKTRVTSATTEAPPVTQASYNISPAGKTEIPSWAANSNTKTKKIEYSQSSYNTGIHSQGTGDYSRYIVTLFAIIAIGVVYLYFQEREKSFLSAMDNFKKEPWSSDFRESFVSSCGTDPTIVTAKDRRLLCHCLSPEVEKAHILSPRYNPKVVSEETHAQINFAEFKKFLGSELGRQARNNCERKLSSE